MQPVQLSLIPDPNPIPPVVLPEQSIAAAITLLAGVIAKTAVPQGLRVAGDG